MPIYLSMPRGINVGGHKKIKMDQLRIVLEAIGLEKVKTYIQSGNIVFKSKSTSPAALSRKIEAAILKDFGHSVTVITRNAHQLAQVVTNNPFLKQSGIDTEKLHVMFMSEEPTPSAVEKLQSFAVPPEALYCIGQEIYFYLPNGVADSLWMKKPIDRILGVVTTTRNWRTVNTLHQMCMDCG